MEELLRPEQARVGLPGDQALLGAKLGGDDLGVELVALSLPLGHDLLKTFAEGLRGRFRLGPEP